MTEDNIAQFTLADIVMPIPGYKVSYPPNEDLKQIYMDLLAADGLENGFQSLQHTVDMYSLPGDYRSIWLKPADVSWSFIRHNDPHEDLLVSDAALLNGNQHKKNSETGEHEALILNLTLPSSTYATVALREAMKIDLGKGSQSLLTETFKETMMAKKRKICDDDNGDASTNGNEEVKKVRASE